MSVRNSTGCEALARSALVTDQRGTSFVMGLILTAAVAVGAVGAIKSIGGRMGGKIDCTGQALASLTPGAPCSAAPEGGVQAVAPEAGEPAPTQTAPIEDIQGPELIGAGPIVALPFPGSVAVTCTALKDQKDTCKDQTGVRVQTSGELSIERSPTRLDISGCPKQDLAVNTKLQLELSGKAKGKAVSGTLSVFTGSASKFKVTVPPQAADAIARGDRPAPNPIDPTSLGPGESLELAEEFFAGHKLQGTYRELQAELGFEAGRRLSAGVRRIDPRTVRIFVGDADFVRNALSLGISVGEFGLQIGGKEELANGDLRAVDIDISTPEGFAAYQKFILEGLIPVEGTPGTANPISVESLDFSDVSKVEAKIGRFKLGGVLGDSEGHVLETRHADGSVETAFNSRFNDVGLTIRDLVSPDGSSKKNFSIFLEGVDPTSIQNFEAFNGTSLAASPEGNVRLDFTEADLNRTKEQALDQVVQRAKDTRKNISREELERLLREDPRRLEQMGLNDGFDFAFEIARAGSPEEVLRFLYLMGGPGGNGTRAVDNLLNFAMKTARAQNGNRAIPKDNPASRLPGKGVAPSCGT